MYNLDILDLVSFQTCNKPLRNIDYRTLDVLVAQNLLRIHILYGSVAHGMNYLLTSGVQHLVSLPQEIVCLFLR